jgi:hypothetical protein
MLKLLKLPLGFLLGTTLALAVTNPTEQDYADYVIWTMQERVCAQQSQTPLCSVMEALPSDLAAKMVKQYTQRRNFVFFSLYSTNFFGLESRSIGFGKVFIQQKPYRPPTTTFLIRTWGPPTLTGSGDCPPFPQPPFLYTESLPIASISFSV